MDQPSPPLPGVGPPVVRGAPPLSSVKAFTFPPYLATSGLAAERRQVKSVQRAFRPYHDCVGSHEGQDTVSVDLVGVSLALVHLSPILGPRVNEHMWGESR